VSVVFRLAPVFRKETLDCGELFHDEINLAVHRPPDTQEDKQQRNQDRYVLQVKFEALVRRDLGRPIAAADSGESRT
jgi:hypothetical protein